MDKDKNTLEKRLYYRTKIWIPTIIIIVAGIPLLIFLNNPFINSILTVVGIVVAGVTGAKRKQSKH
jgi:predicted cobalt transporter CbtA